MQIPSAITYHPGQIGHIPMRYSTEHETSELRLVLDVLREGEGFGLPRLVDFAERQHGWGNSDSGFGVTYPEDLDEYDRKVEGWTIPSGHVELYRFWGPPAGDSIIISERDYLLLLLHVLQSRGMMEHAQRVERLLSFHEI